MLVGNDKKHTQGGKENKYTMDKTVARSVANIGV